MVKIFLSLILVLVSACGGSRELNLNALDLSRYSAQLDSFPSYVDLMKPGNPGVISAEVAEISKFFADKSQPKQLFLVGQPGTEADARVQAFARHDANSRVVEVKLDVLSQDAKIQAWTETEYDRVLEAVLSKNNSGNTVFLFSEPVAQISLYNSIIKPFAAVQKPVFEKLSKTKRAMPIEDIPRSELTVYLMALMPDRLEQARQLALLTYAYVPSASAFDIISLLDLSENAVEAVYQEFLRRNQSPEGDDLTAVKHSMSALLQSPDADRLAVFYRKFFRNPLNAKTDKNLEHMSKMSQSFKDQYELNRKAYCLDVLKYANANAVPDSMKYLLEDCEEKNQGETK